MAELTKPARDQISATKFAFPRQRKEPPMRPDYPFPSDAAVGKWFNISAPNDIVQRLGGRIPLFGGRWNPNALNFAVNTHHGMFGAHSALHNDAATRTDWEGDIRGGPIGPSGPDNGENKGNSGDNGAQPKPPVPANTRPDNIATGPVEEGIHHVRGFCSFVFPGVQSPSR